MPSRTWFLAGSTRWLVVAVCATAVLAFFAKRAYDQRVQSLERLAQWEQEQQQDAWLDKTVEIKLAGEVPLSEWLAELTRQAGVKLTLHKSDAYQHDMPEVCLPLPPQAARDALQAVALEVPLRWRPHDGRLVVDLLGSREWPSVELQTHLLRSSLSPQLQHQVAESVQTYVEPDAWEDVGGHGTLVEVPGQLVIVQPYDTHLRIRKFLDKLQTHLEQAAAIPAIGLAADDLRLQPMELQAPFQRWTKAKRALERKISLDVVEMPLKDVVEQLRDKLNVPLVMVQKRLEAAGVQPDQPVTLRVENMRAAAIFEMMLLGKNAGVMPTRGGGDLLRIVPLDDKVSLESLSLVAYALPDFVGNSADQDLDHLGEVLRSVVQPDNWQHVGGWGSIERIGNSLLITQLPENHAALERCLQSLRLVRSGQYKRLPLPLQTPERIETEAKLQRPLALKYERVMLHEVLTDLQRRTGLTFQFHGSSYGAGVTPETLVTGDWPAQALEENLKQLLGTLNLTCRVHDEYILVISRSAGRSGASDDCEVIDARPLLRNGICNVGEMCQLLMAAVEPDSWEDIGGRGALDELQGLLIVRQEPDLLAQVRQVYLAVESDWLPNQNGRRFGNLITREPTDNSSPLIRLYAVDDLLKPVGRFSEEELEHELHVSPVKVASKPNESDIPKLSFHCGRYLVAWLHEEHVEPVETKLAELRKRK